MFTLLDISKISIIILLCLSSFFKTYAQNSDTILANNYLSIADSFSYIGKYDSSILFYERASEIYKTAVEKIESENRGIGQTEKQPTMKRFTDSPYHPFSDSVRNLLSRYWEKYISCQNQIGWNLGYIKGEYDKGLEHLEMALNVGLNKLGKEHLQVAKSYNAIGTINAIKANEDDAMEYFNMALFILKKQFGEYHRKVATTYDNIGAIFEQKSDYFTALDYHQHSLFIRLKILDPRHLDVAYSYSNMGVVYMAIDEYDKAYDYFNKALSISIEIFGEHHLEVSVCYTNIGNYYAETGDLDKALEFYNKALTIDLDIIGEEHAEVARFDINLIGGVYSDKGDQLKALECYRKSLKIMHVTLGDKHPYVAETYQGFGLAYERLKDYNTALRYYQKSIVSLLAEFNNSSIYSNPKPDLLEKRKATSSKPHLLEAFINKAEGFEKYYYSKRR